MGKRDAGRRASVVADIARRCDEGFGCSAERRIQGVLQRKIGRRIGESGNDGVAGVIHGDALRGCALEVSRVEQHAAGGIQLGQEPRSLAANAVGIREQTGGLKGVGRGGEVWAEGPSGYLDMASGIHGDVRPEFAKGTAQAGGIDQRVRSGGLRIDLGNESIRAIQTSLQGILDRKAQATHSL